MLNHIEFDYCHFKDRVKRFHHNFSWSIFNVSRCCMRDYWGQKLLWPVFHLHGISSLAKLEEINVPESLFHHFDEFLSLWHIRTLVLFWTFLDFSTIQLPFVTAVHEISDVYSKQSTTLSYNHLLVDMNISNSLGFWLYWGIVKVFLPFFIGGWGSFDFE